MHDGLANRSGENQPINGPQNDTLIKRCVRAAAAIEATGSEADPTQGSAGMIVGVAKSLATVVVEDDNLNCK